MILNAYAILDGFVGLLRLLLGLVVVVLALRAWAQLRSAQVPDDRLAVEDRGYLLFLLAVTLVGLNLVAWPLLYLLLQSYVPEWQGIMCIYGVTRIGAGSDGVSRHLPALVAALQLTKPALVFLGGAWLTLYLVNRRTRTAPLAGRLLAVLLLVGALAAADAAVELTYLAIPKKEEYLSTGCCTGVFASEGHDSRFLPKALLGENHRPRLYGAYYGVNVAMVLALAVFARRGRRRNPARGLAWLLAGAVAALLVSIAFLIEIAAPKFLGLPYHHCPYDLLPDVPESVLGMALFLLGVFSVGWACAAGWFGQNPETRAVLGATVANLLRVAEFGFLGSLVFMSVELTLT